MGIRISVNNSKKLSTPEEQQTECTHRGNCQCLFQGQCKSKDNIYLAEVSKPDNDIIHSYIGASSTEIRARIATHQSDSRSEIRNTRTTLSAKVYELREAGVNHQVVFNRITQASSYKVGAKACNLCTKEVEHILFNTTVRGTKLNSRK